MLQFWIIFVGVSKAEEIPLVNPQLSKFEAVGKQLVDKQLFFAGETKSGFSRLSFFGWLYNFVSFTHSFQICNFLANSV